MLSNLSPVILSLAHTREAIGTVSICTVQYSTVQYSTVLHQPVQYLYSVPLHPPLESPGLYCYTPPGEYLVKLFVCKHSSLLSLIGPSVLQLLLLIVLDLTVDTLSTAFLASWLQGPLGPLYLQAHTPLSTSSSSLSTSS